MQSLKQTLTENSYSREEELIFADCDRDGRARVSTLLSFAAAVAGHDYDARNLPYEKLYALGQVFLLSRLSLRLHRCPRMGEVVRVTTWEDGIRGAQMQRVYEIADGQGAVCVSMRSDWLLVDPRSRRILRPKDFTARTLTVCPKEIDCAAPGKLLMPKEGAEDWGIHTVRWSELDPNGHLYSGNYGDVIWDALPEDLQERLPREFEIHYSKEATLGQELRLLGVREENGFTVEGVGPEGTCFIARARL